MPRLTELEVEEVSLVDRPATGRRFRIFKRAAPGGFWERWFGGEENMGSPSEGKSGEGEAFDLARLAKRLDETLDAVAESVETLAAQVEAIQKRLDDAISAESMEEPAPVRQSLDPRGERRPSIWKGVL